MALDLKFLKAANERIMPFREGLEALATLIDAAVESEQLIEKTQKQVDSANSELNRLQKNVAEQAAELADLVEAHFREREEHKASIRALTEEKQKLLAQMDSELKEHKARIQVEMDHASRVHNQNLATYAAEQAKAKKQLDAAQKSLAEMTDRVRLTLGL